MNTSNNEFYKQMKSKMFADAEQIIALVVGFFGDEGSNYIAETIHKYVTQE